MLKQGSAFGEYAIFSSHSSCNILWCNYKKVRKWSIWICTENVHIFFKTDIFTLQQHAWNSISLFLFTIHFLIFFIFCLVWLICQFSQTGSKCLNTEKAAVSTQNKIMQISTWPQFPLSLSAEAISPRKSLNCKHPYTKNIPRRSQCREKAISTFIFQRSIRTLKELPTTASGRLLRSLLVDPSNFG